MPSRGGTVDKHRQSRYRLTEEGERVAALAGSRRELADELTTASLAQHPYLRALLEELDEAPLFCPEATHGQVVKNSSRRYWAERGVALLARSDPRVEISADELELHMAQAYTRRFGRRRAEGERASAKDVAKALSAILADAALEARGLRFGATTLESLCDLGVELRLLDQSRYVPGHDDGNMIWLCSDLERDGERLLAHRRGFTEHGQRVARELVETYFQLRANPSSGLEGDRRTGTYQMIHVVRAAAAFQTRTARDLGNRALEALAIGKFDLSVRVRLQAARFEKPPRSEPMYTRGGTRALTLTMTQANGARDSADQSLPEEKQ